jgi:hypothetical protein
MGIGRGAECGLLGGAPNAVEHEQKILVFVFNWAWTSSPITASNSIGGPLH